MTTTCCGGHYERGEDGAWRYAGSRDLVPGAQDMTLSSLYNLPITRDGAGRAHVIVPASLARNEPDLAWCLDAATGPARDPGHLRGDDRDPNIPVDALLVPLGVWEEHDRVVGLWAPELHPDAILDVHGVARLLGVSDQTVRAYVSRRLLPDPCGHLMGSPWWTRPVITRWQATRPGRGAGGGRPRKQS